METIAEPIPLILSALARGSVSTNDIVTSKYATLKNRIREKFAGNFREESALAEYLDDPETYQLPLRKALLQEHVDQDREVVREAQQLLTLLGEEAQRGLNGRVQGTVQIYGSVVTGNPNHIVNHTLGRWESSLNGDQKKQPLQADDQSQKMQALLDLLDTWYEEGDEEEQKNTWEYLKQSFDED